MIAEMNNIDLDFQENYIPNTNHYRVSNEKYSSRKMSPRISAIKGEGITK